MQLRSQGACTFPLCSPKKIRPPYMVEIKQDASNSSTYHGLSFVSIKNKIKETYEEVSNECCPKNITIDSESRGSFPASVLPQTPMAPWLSLKSETCKKELRSPFPVDFSIRTERLSKKTGLIHEQKLKNQNLFRSPGRSG